MTREEVYLKEYLDDDIGMGRVATWGCDNLEYEDVLEIEEIMNNYDDERARELIEELLTPTKFKERGMTI